MTVGEFVRCVNEVLGAPELATRRILSVVPVGREGSQGRELSAVTFYLDMGLGVRPDAESAVRVADERVEER